MNFLFVISYPYTYASYIRVFMEEIFIGGCTPPFTSFLDFWLRSLKMGKIFFANVITIISGIYFWNCSRFRWVEFDFRGTPNFKSWGVFQTFWPRQVGWTRCIDLNFDMYSILETLESSKMFWGISDIFDVSMTSPMSDFHVILPFFVTVSVISL